MLLIGVLRQEGDGRVGWSGLRLGEGLRVTDTLVAHDLSRIQLLRTPSRVLQVANTHDKSLSVGLLFAVKSVETGATEIVRLRIIFKMLLNVSLLLPPMRLSASRSSMRVFL